MKFHFFKYQGTGNDFVIFDSRNENIELSQQQIASICHRHFGVGADGLMKLCLEDGFDFKMIYYNADGLLGSMCGNGARCITKFAWDMGIHKSHFHFSAPDGPHESHISDDGIIQLQMKNIDAGAVNHQSDYDLLDTGSPHYVKSVTNIKSYPVLEEGKSIRNSNKFSAQGVNVNFVERIGASEIFVRTYERGVEAETMSCGTGVTASALINAHNENGFNHVDVKTLGGRLFVEFESSGQGSFKNIWLCGPAIKVFEGDIEI
jgi:diaminopimelate epimerase